MFRHCLDNPSDFPVPPDQAVAEQLEPPVRGAFFLFLPSGAPVRFVRKQDSPDILCNQPREAVDVP